MKSLLMLFAALAALSVTAFAQPAVVDVGARAPDFDLKDQFGKSWSLSGLNGGVTVLIVADSDSGRAMGPWVDALKSRYPSKVNILGMLDLHTVPGIGRGIAKSRIRKETKDPLMLDFSGNIARAYGVSSKVPTVVVIDKTGIVRALARQAFDQTSFAGITTAVDKALK
jgi:predicted transcriptional regulator